ncbi:UDP-N-acetylmuramoylalanyl-D-glutamate--2,6-diaminopimelate ligase [Anaerobacillus alkalidiazotrophicus]|uniref:UDP-N-acetylmuramoyl-tripeptide--D-alanyl-D-alanine ligase n=1 Tax=Anaerobacillus alkalidiazotrophicus TaxID=472963 RepID=A0A1S2LZ41_9BACI|nr:UDP-N-acetylmuramoyl-tripeptide--D-alanyl-D-alanine ligase [Anaerobacillus alkalidiazotrophicus]OIJ17741.1 UDP-N-acetylmuramoylalanyl-D-glutamate--2,6-diaminopimelate ligase [Anaerobacillus alkalidiazotrophicus]
MSFKINMLKGISSNFRGEINDETMIEAVFIDSRNKVQNGLFIPIIGERFDGHDFLFGAIESGAVATLWNESKPLPEGLEAEFPVIYVKDTLLALQNLSKNYLQKVSPKVIGVTGSNGKTTVKDLLEAVLCTTYRTHKTQGNFNNHIGLPLTILAMPNDCEVAILEMGMNHFGEISLLSNIAQPDIVIITNIGESHIEQLGSRDGIAQAKFEIIHGLKENGVLIYDGDEPLLNSHHVDLNKIECGYNDTNDYIITNLEQTANGSKFSLNNKYDFVLPLLGKHNVKNSTYSIAVGKYLGLSEHTIQLGLNNCILTSMRMEKKQGINGSIIINDAYNSSPTSMKAAIETVKDLGDFDQRILVLGDMYELGIDERNLHRSVCESITSPITHLFTVGEKGNWISEALLERNTDNIVIRSFESKEEVLENLKNIVNDSSIVLIKASRGMKLETIATSLYM